jgi:prophage regulatory protein
VTQFTFSLQRLPAVVARVGLSRSSIYAGVKNGTFPAPVRLGDGRAVAWDSRAIDRWIEERLTHVQEREGCNAR